MIKSEHMMEGLSQIFEGLRMGDKLRMHGCFRYPVYAGWKASTQNYKDLHILYVRGGRGYYHMPGGIKIPLVKGSLVMITTGVVHNGSVDACNPLEISGIRFGLYNHDEHKSAIIKPFYCGMQPQNMTRIDQLALEIHHAYHDVEDDLQELLCATYLIQFMTVLYDATRLGRVIHQRDIRVESIKNDIENSIGKNVRIEDIATNHGISIRYLQKCFKRLYGVTPKEYALQVMMDQAYMLLSYENKTSKAVALTMGYSDQYAFSRQFKKHFGYPPSHVKKHRV